MACSSAIAQTPLSAYVDSNGFIDVQTLTCAQLAGTFQEDADALTAWYSGWYNGLAKKHYMRTPLDILVECGWGGREVDDVTPPVEMTTLGSFWGHKGLFDDLGAPTPVDETRRAPVQVMEGNYELM